MDDTQLSAGMRARWGAYVDRARERTTEFTADFQQLITRLGPRYGRGPALNRALEPASR